MSLFPNIAWALRGFYGNYDIYGTSAVKTITVSKVTGNVFLSYDTGGESMDGTLRYHLQKLDKDGNQLWKLSGENYAFCCAADTLPGDCVYVGYADSVGPILAKLDADGNTLWTYGDINASNIYGKSIAVKQDGSIVAAMPYIYDIVPIGGYNWAWSTVIDTISPNGSYLGGVTIAGQVSQIALDPMQNSFSPGQHQALMNSTAMQNLHNSADMQNAMKTGDVKKMQELMNSDQDVKAQIGQDNLDKMNKLMSQYGGNMMTGGGNASGSRGMMMNGSGIGNTGNNMMGSGPNL